MKSWSFHKIVWHFSKCYGFLLKIRSEGLLKLLPAIGSISLAQRSEIGLHPCLETLMSHMKNSQSLLKVSSLSLQLKSEIHMWRGNYLIFCSVWKSINSILLWHVTGDLLFQFRNNKFFHFCVFAAGLWRGLSQLWWRWTRWVQRDPHARINWTQLIWLPLTNRSEPLWKPQCLWVAVAFQSKLLQQCL